MPWGYWGALSTLADLGPSALLWAIDKLLAPALVAVLFSGLTNIGIDRWKARRDIITKLVDNLRTDLLVLQQAATDYWNRPYRADDIVIEARLIAMQNEAISAATLLRDRYNVHVGTDEQMANLADAVSGGEFGSHKRKKDLSRVAVCISLFSGMRQKVLEERLKVFDTSGS